MQWVVEVRARGRGGGGQAAIGADADFDLGAQEFVLDADGVWAVDADGLVVGFVVVRANTDVESVFLRFGVDLARRSGGRGDAASGDGGDFGFEGGCHRGWVVLVEGGYERREAEREGDGGIGEDDNDNDDEDDDIMTVS